MCDPHLEFVLSKCKHVETNATVTMETKPPSPASKVHHMTRNPRKYDTETETGEISCWNELTEGFASQKG